MSTASNVPLMFQPLVKYVDFQGRARRSEFWLWVLFRILIGMATGAIASSLLFQGLSMKDPTPAVFMQNYFRIFPFVWLINLALLLPSLAVGVRRLHDIGRTGWWLALPHATAIVGITLFMITNGASFFSLMTKGESMSDAQTVNFLVRFIGTLMLFVGLPTLIARVVLLVFYVTEGVATPNRFGDNPKGAEDMRAANHIV